MVGALLAEVRIGRRTNPGRKPDPRLLVVVQAVRTGLQVSQIFSSPNMAKPPSIGLALSDGVFGSRTGSFTSTRFTGSAARTLSVEFSVAPKTRPLAFTGWIALVAHRCIVQVGLRVRPVPHRDHVDALRGAGASPPALRLPRRAGSTRNISVARVPIRSLTMLVAA